MVGPAGPAGPTGPGLPGAIWPDDTTPTVQPPRSRRPLVAAVIAVIVLVAAVIGAISLWTAADRRYSDNVASFARAPVGCDTTLSFERAGEFVLYLETTGRIDEMPGDCDLADEYDRASDGLPRPELALRPAGDAVDADDKAGIEEVELSPTAGVDYDTDGYVGTAYRLADVPAAGDYVLTVADEVDEPYAIALGGDPAAGVAGLRWGALAVLVVGMLVAGILLVLARRRPTTPTAGRSGWPPDDQPPVAWPTSPPAVPAHWSPTPGPMPPWAPPAPHGEREW